MHASRKLFLRTLPIIFVVVLLFSSMRIDQVCSSSEFDVAVFVDESIYSDIESSLSQFEIDLNNEGLTVKIANKSLEGLTAESMRTTLQQWWINYSIKGCILIGDFPAALFEYSMAKFSTDIFYMDLDGTWEDTDNDTAYDQHTGDTEIEIWVGRLKASNLQGSSEADLLNKYFDKNHRYRTANAPILPRRALVYYDDDFAYYSETANQCLSLVYDDVTVVDDPETTNAQDYKNRINSSLTEGYEWLLLGCHGQNLGRQHIFKEGGKVYSSDYLVNELDPPVFFYNWWTCWAANHTTENCLASSAIFNNTYGLLSIGCEYAGFKPHTEFFQPLSENKSIGTAFVEWFNIWGLKTYYESYYSTVILGDPTLCPSPRSHRLTAQTNTTTGSEMENVSVWIDNDPVRYSPVNVTLFEGNHSVKVESPFYNGSTGYTFESWEDNSTSNPRAVYLDSNVTIVAYYKVFPNLTVLAEDQNGTNLTSGYVYIDGEYYGRTGSTFGVSPGTHEVFVSDWWESNNTGNRYCWYPYGNYGYWEEDNSTNNPRNITVTENETITAHFNKKYCPGDANGNGFVLSDDIIIIQKAGNYGHTTAEAEDPYADVNGNGFVLSDDIIIIQNNYGKTY